MRFAVVTLGSAGDLHPFLAIARALAERGHEVHLLSQEPYAQEVRAEGVGFLPIATVQDHERTLRHPLLWHPLHGFGVLWRHLAVPAIGPTIEALDKLSQGAPLSILASPLAVGARLAREKWPQRVHCLLSGYTAPMALRSTEDPMFLGGWRVPGWIPPVVRRSLWWGLDRWKLEPMARPAMNRWSEKLGLSAPGASLFGEALHSVDGGMALYPGWFAPVPPRWVGRGVTQLDFPLFEPQHVADEAAATAEFVADPHPYVVAYPGSAEQRVQAFASCVLPACKAMGLRVLVLSPFGNDVPASGSVLHVGYASLRRVLGRSAVFIHHGGVGSIAQGLAAEVPQLVLASAYDQFENGAHLERLHRGRWLRLSQASTERVLEGIRHLMVDAPPAATGHRPEPSLPGAPNVGVRQACEILEGRSTD